MEPIDWRMVRDALACDCNLTDDQCCDKCQTPDLIVRLAETPPEAES